VDHRALDAAPLCDVVSADDDHVEGHFEAAKLSAKPGGLRAKPWNLRLDYEQVEVRFGTGIAASVGTKEDHPRVRGGLGESAARLCNQRLIRHSVKVAHCRDDQLECAWRDVLGADRLSDPAASWALSGEGSGKGFADEGGLCLGVALAVMLETPGEAPLEVGVPLREVGIRP
jgi:hypothetical protein